MRNQEIKNLTITDLKLWSENPRDPLKNEITDFEIIKNAIINKESKWNLNKLMKQIGEFYDYSELPIVVKIDSQYIVYDGNRRIGLIKYLQSEAKYNKAGAKLAHKNKHEFLDLKKIPCNVCTMNIALDNIERKHIDNGTWNELERDYFMNIHRGEEKSIFIKIDEACGIISNNYKLNKGYVKNEILTKSNLESIGIGLDCNNEISTIYDIEFTKILIDHIVEIISSKEITTRVNRGKLKEVLTNKNLNRPLQKFEESLKKYTLEYVYKSDSTSDGFASGGSASGGSASGGSASGGSASDGSASGGSASGGSASGGSASGGSASGGSASGGSASGGSASDGSASDGSASGGSASGGSASGGSASGGNRGSIKKKPTLKRKGLHPGIKVRIEEYFNLPATVYPNAKIAMSRVLFEIVLKYVIEYTKFNGRTTMDKCGYFQPVYRGKFADATLMKLKFTDLINVTVDKKHFQDFDLEKMHQVIHNYKTGGLVIDAENYNNSLIFLIEFLLQDEQDLLNSLDITKL